ncbi:MAG TPA: DUF885 family protein, partial [Gammaproteobacteria bacterium]|nr:DUF885 family protein [Gammaproteobacteria bacterium]
MSRSRRSLGFAAGVVALTAITAMQHTRSLAATPADVAFEQQFGNDFFDRLWQLYPDRAVETGYYKYADRLAVPDARARAARLEQNDRWAAELRRIDPAELSPNFRADWEMLDNEFAATRWYLTELREWQWNPAAYNVADAFDLIVTRDYAPLEDRLRAFNARLASVPAYYAAAKASIERPTREHTELAIEQNRGALEVFGAELEST